MEEPVVEASWKKSVLVIGGIPFSVFRNSSDCSRIEVASPSDCFFRVLTDKKISGKSIHGCQLRPESLKVGRCVQDSAFPENCPLRETVIVNIRS